jgi:polysaccharide biosynthesis protein PslG
MGAGAFRRLLAAVASGLAALAFAGTAPAAVPGVVTDLTWGISSADQDKTVSAIHDLGARWARISIQWQAWETSRGSYDPWEVERADRAVALCNARGIHLLVDVYNAPGWAAGTNGAGEGNVPRNMADFADFMRYVSSRYKGRVEAYEVWNEPDIQRFWSPGPNAAAYARLLESGYDAVKSVDPGALVVSGGLSWDYGRPNSFLSQMYAAGAKGSFDVLGIHDYPDESIATGLSTWPNGFSGARVDELSHGDSKPIWITEFGLNTAAGSSGWQPGVTPDRQAALVTRAFDLAAAAPWVQVLFYYNLRNDWWSHDDPTSMEAQFGLMTTNFEKKPAYYAFQRYAQQARTDGLRVEKSVASPRRSAFRARVTRRLRFPVERAQASIAVWGSRGLPTRRSASSR